METNYMPENWIERCVLDYLKSEGYLVIQCNKWLPDGTGRSNRSQVMLMNVLFENLYKRYPDIPDDVIENGVRKLLLTDSDSDLAEINRRVRHLIRHGIMVRFEKNGRKKRRIIKLINFKKPKNNIYIAASQMWIRFNRDNWCRPDVILFINGLPIVFFELKNNYTDVRNGYDINLKKYISKIPQLFSSNCFCVLSNGVETRYSSCADSFNKYSPWQITSEEERYIKRKGKLTWQNLKSFILGFCKPSTLIAYIMSDL